MKPFDFPIFFFILTLTIQACFSPIEVMADSRQNDSTIIDTARRIGIPDHAVDRLFSSGRARKLDRSEITALLHFLIMVKKRGFDVIPFLNKIDEGFVKKIPLSRIRSVLKQKLENYQFIESLAGNFDTRHRSYYSYSIALLSETLNFGLSRDDLRELFVYRPQTPLNIMAVAAETKAFLKQLGFSASGMETIIRSGLDNETLTFEWRKLASIIAGARRRGLSDKEITAIVVKQLQKRGDIRAILPELGYLQRNVTNGPGAPR
jgi:hypothetical protein